LFLEELEKLAEWLISDTPKTAAVLEEQTVRLLATTVILLRQHQVNKRGQCQFCSWTRWTRQLSRRRRRCTVHQALELGMGQSLDVVWWRVCESMGRQWSLTEVRAWVAKKAANASSPGPAETAQVALTGEGGGGGADSAR
jgi:hypothetical protein